MKTRKDLKKVLIVVYYWPPAGGVAVQRWYKFAKYLPEFGYEPIIYTVENGEFTDYDYSLDDLSEQLSVIREPIREPYKLYKKFTGKKKSEKIKQEGFSEHGFKERMAVWIRGNFFIPDARKFWINRSVSRLKLFIEANKIDLIVSNGTPHSCHIIGLKLKKQFGIPWIADFRDPWTKVDYFDKLKLSGSAERKHRSLEQQVIKNANVVTTVSWSWEKDFQGLGALNTGTITNGFDPADFNGLSTEKSNRFEMTHLGSLSKDRFHPQFWDVIVEEIKRNPRFKKLLKINLVGNVDPVFFQYFKKVGLSEYVIQFGHVEHREGLKLASESHILLLLLGDKQKSKGRIPAKVFEYMAIAQPVLAYGQEPSDLAKIVSTCALGSFIQFDDFESLKKCIQKMFNDFESGVNFSPNNKNEIAKYERKYLCSQMAQVFDNTLSTK